jgi:hypothetical protein
MKTANLSLSFLESLEARLAPAGLVTLNLSASGALTITGDALDNDFVITESGNEWTISNLSGGTGTTEFRLNGGDALSSLTFAAPLSVKAKLGAGNDEMVLDGVTLPKTLTVDAGDGNDVVDLTGTAIAGAVKINMGNGNDLFTAGGDLYFGKGLNVSLGKGTNTFDVNATEFISDGNVVATAGGTATEAQAFVLKTAIGEINGTLNFRTTTASPTEFEIGDLTSDVLSVTKAMTLQSAAGNDLVTLRGDLLVGGVLSIRLGNGDNSVVTTNLDQLATKGLTYVGGSGVDNFTLQAREAIVDGNFAFTGGAGNNILDLNTSGFLEVTRGLTYKGGAGADTLILDGPDVYVFGVVNMSAGAGSNALFINALDADLGGVRYTGGAGADRIDIGEMEGASNLIKIEGPVTINTGAGDSDIQIIDSYIYGNLSITSGARLGFIDEVRLFESDFLGNVTVRMGAADSYFEINDSVFDRNVNIFTGAGWDEVRFDTDTVNTASTSHFKGNVYVNLGAGNDAFYAGSNPIVASTGNDFEGYVDIVGGAGYDKAYFINSAFYNNYFNGPIPLTYGVEDFA